MHRILTVILALIALPAWCQKANPFQYCIPVKEVSGKTQSQSGLKALVEIWDNDSLVFSENHFVRPDSSSLYCLSVGRGEVLRGRFDSILWSVGSYFLITDFRESSSGKSVYRKKYKMREPEDLRADHEEGSFELKEGFGLFNFRHSRQRKPKRIQVDISTSYVNTAYPADTYPLYRHYEWLDDDRDGLGTAFFISFSDNSRNGFAVSTRRLGEVDLHGLLFQEVMCDSGADQIRVELTRPQPVVLHGQTYRIKGPATLIYYFEW